MWGLRIKREANLPAPGNSRMSQTPSLVQTPRARSRSAWTSHGDSKKEEEVASPRNNAADKCLLASCQEEKRFTGVQGGKGAMPLWAALCP